MLAEPLSRIKGKGRDGTGRILVQNSANDGTLLILDELNGIGRCIDRIGFSQWVDLAGLSNGPALQLSALLEVTSSSVPQSLARSERARWPGGCDGVSGGGHPGWPSAIPHAGELRRFELRIRS